MKTLATVSPATVGMRTIYGVIDAVWSEVETSRGVSRWDSFLRAGDRLLQAFGRGDDPDTGVVPFDSTTAVEETMAAVLKAADEAKVVAARPHTWVKFGSVGALVLHQEYSYVWGVPLLLPLHEGGVAVPTTEAVEKAVVEMAREHVCKNTCCIGREREEEYRNEIVAEVLPFVLAARKAATEVAAVETAVAAVETAAWSAEMMNRYGTNYLSQMIRGGCF